MNRRFAIKFLRVDLATQRGALERFQREASVAGGLERENVAAVMDFGVAADGAPFIVMEYLAGETLACLLRRLGRLPVGRAADLCVQASLGLAAAHAAGVVHRDLKPQNLFVCRRSDGSDLLKVLDFGVAKLEEAESHGMVTATGATLGTPFYMAPEQARGEDVCDERTDVYGLGAVLYEMLSGRRPHGGDSNNAVMHHMCTQAAIPLSVNTGVPLVDAFLWIKNPGESDGSCNIAGGGRAWDYAPYNPWGNSGEALAHFDPLWGMVDPAVGEWFPAQALQLALGDGRPIENP